MLPSHTVTILNASMDGRRQRGAKWWNDWIYTRHVLESVWHLYKLDPGTFSFSYYFYVSSVVVGGYGTPGQAGHNTREFFLFLFLSGSPSFCVIVWREMKGVYEWMQSLYNISL